MSDFAEISSFIEKNINTALGEHRGSCEVSNLEDGVLSLRLVGGCAHCPSSRLTMYEFIVPTLQESFPDLKDVILV